MEKAIPRRFFRTFAAGFFWLAALALAPLSSAQTLLPAPPAAAGPIAIVPLDNKHPDAAAKVTGALEVSQGKAIIAASGTVTSGSQTTEVILPRRGVLRVCASTTVKLVADASVPAGETPGLMMALDHGAVETSFAAGRNSDMLMTPDFRILIGAPGRSEVKVRLGQQGDTCVDNAGADAPYVLVTSIFEGGNYRVQPGQRVMFEHGSLHEVVDNEKEPCGCPPPSKGGNEFPLAQSEGLAPLPQEPPVQASPSSETGKSSRQHAVPTEIEPLVYKSKSAAPAAPPAPKLAAAPAPAVSKQANPVAKKKKSGHFSGIGRFFHHFFGAE